MNLMKVYKKCLKFPHLSRNLSTYVGSSKLKISNQPSLDTSPPTDKYGQVTNDITKAEYIKRQYALMKSIRNNSPNFDHHFVILSGSPKRFMIDRIPYRFRQDTDMLYMCGCLETDCVLVLHTIPSSTESYKAVMFTPIRDPAQEQWDGPRTPHSVASDIWPVSEALPISEFHSYVASIKREARSMNLWYHRDEALNPKFYRFFSTDFPATLNTNIQSPKSLIHALRLVKSEAEIQLMRQTCQISSESIKAAIKSCPSPALEHHLCADVDYGCRMRGAEYLAYPPVVAGGNRANIIHYINNNNIVQPGELVLMDAGSECKGYSGDVSRTWPINGKFSSAQRDVYEAVLEVQKYIIDACAQRPSLDHLFTLMCSKLGLVLRELCILPKDMEGSQLSRSAFGFCPHHVSHYLGMDVHDTPSVPKSNRTAVGSVITVEPGIYINENNKEVDLRYKGIGIRLEDDVLIGEDGVEILTQSCPKDPEQIELLVGADLR